MRGSFEALRERQFRLLFTGQIISLLGDAVSRVALAFAILDPTGSATDLGIVFAAKTAAAGSLAMAMLAIATPSVRRLQAA